MDLWFVVCHEFWTVLSILSSDISLLSLSSFSGILITYILHFLKNVPPVLGCSLLLLVLAIFFLFALQLRSYDRPVFTLTESFLTRRGLPMSLSEAFFAAVTVFFDF